MFNEVYGELNCKETCTVADLIANKETFDKELGKIVNIIVSYDMGWSKRGTGKSYDSLNGYGAVIGFLSGRILDNRTRNRMCQICKMSKPGQAPKEHDCRLNFQGSAMAMEANAGNDMINNSTIMRAAGVDPRIVVGDEDSPTMCPVRRDSVNQKFKLYDGNHSKVNFGRELYKLRSDYNPVGQMMSI